MSNRVLLVCFLLAVVGFADAVFLSLMHFQQGDFGCSLITGCDVVLSSEYAVLAGIPLSYLGVLYYLTLLTGFAAYYQTEATLVHKGIAGISGTGLFFSLWLVYLQAFVLEAFCQYCLLSAIVTTSIFTITAIALAKKKPDA